MTTLRERVLGGETTFGSWLSMASPVAAEIAGQAGFDWLVIDTEHGMGGEGDVLPQLHAIGHTSATAAGPDRTERPTAHLARPRPRRGWARRAAHRQRRGRRPGPRPGCASRRPVSAGSRSGVRGQGFGRVGHGDIGSLNDVALGVFQIETASAVADAEAIAALPGADVLFVGPADLSHALGVPGGFEEPIYLAALDEVVAACRAHGKAAGILLYDPAAIAPHLERGFTFVGLGSDGSFVMGGAKAMLAAAGRG